ncbi:MAG TPA: type II toxin-antitoxin system RelE/ParE family toxin [Polyangiaceae bacterium]|nr:type II toxin-antitoxin system RelE/ParE family toxin [Polyangiaceae bacterium]
MARAHRLEPAARAELDAHLKWLDEHNTGAAARFVGALENALETLASGVADGRPVTLPDGRRVRRWYVRPLILYYVREGGDVVVLRARHEARRPLERG